MVNDERSRPSERHADQITRCAPSLHTGTVAAFGYSIAFERAESLRR